MIFAMVSSIWEFIADFLGFQTTSFAPRLAENTSQTMDRLRVRQKMAYVVLFKLLIIFICNQMQTGKTGQYRIQKNYN